MQLKRMVVVAAAAVAGQTLLMAAPAMAETQPSATVPDAEPAAEPGTAEPGTAEPGTAQTQAPVPGQAQGQTQGQTRAVGVEGEDSEPSDRLLMGPEVTVRGVPQGGFPADGSWTPLTVTVDNSGHVTVPGYTPVLGVVQPSGAFLPSHVDVEFRTAGGAWQAAPRTQDPDAAPALRYALGAAASVPAGQVRTIEVRIGFAAGTPVVPFDLTADGTSRVGNTTGTSPASSYATRITGAPGGDEEPLHVEGPALTVSGVPADMRAGGDWTDLTVRVDNAGKGALAAFATGLVVARPDFVSMDASQISVEARRTGADGAPTWQPLEVLAQEDGYLFAAGLTDGPVAAGQLLDVEVRVRFAADTPTGSVSFFSWGTSQVDAETPPPWATSHSPRHLTTLLTPAPTTETPGGTPGTDPGGTPGGDPGGTPGGDPGTDPGGTPGTDPGGTPGGDPGGTPGGTPGTDPGGTPGGTPGGAPGTDPGGTPGGTPGTNPGGTGTPGGNAGNAPVPNGGAQPVGGAPLGELAATGSATGWALGGAGLSVALGVALAAGTGRHRRRTTT
ncbi:hypothetical protein ACIRP0_13590 [Streptomyces sp. NPDC101733]|uniref:hypothetical protein n=1 Tax=unclassified Streptomyces TaxID=2593676 RepID=UPI0037F281D4